MARFARKYGGGGPRVPLEHDEVPRELRHHLWTVVRSALAEICQSELIYWSSGAPSPEGEWLDRFWTEVLEQPAGQRGNFHPDQIQEWFYEGAEWFQVYDLVEFIASTPLEITLIGPNERSQLDGFASRVNAVLEAEQSPWRLLDSELVPIASPAELGAVSQLLATGPELVRTHIARALDNLSQRPAPNVHGAIAEAVHAIESAAKHFLGRTDGTYGQLKRELQERGVHPAFVHAFDKLYGYAGDEGGLRHGFKPGDDPTKHVAEGRLFVVIASAYANYLLECRRPRKSVGIGRDPQSGKCVRRPRVS